MPLIKMPFQPGVDKQVTEYGAEGTWFDSDNMRFRYSLPEKIGGHLAVALPQGEAGGLNVQGEVIGALNQGALNLLEALILLPGEEQGLAEEEGGFPALAQRHGILKDLLRSLGLPGGQEDLAKPNQGTLVGGIEFSRPLGHGEGVLQPLFPQIGGGQVPVGTRVIGH